MKIFEITSSCVSAALIIHLFSCQTTDGLTGLKIKTSEIITPLHQSALPANTAPNFRNEIPVKAVREFIDEFQDAVNVTWRKVGDDGYIADSKSDSIKTIAFYYRNGSCSYILKKYGENKMPADVRAMVKSIFYDYTITEVTEIRLRQYSENMIYSVLIKNADNYKILRICNNEMEITRDYTKP